MKISAAVGLGLAALIVFVCGGCGAPGAPVPPSLELPRPVSDVAATRKGNHVRLTWTAPRLTTDEINVRHAGPTRICRAVDQLVVSQCDEVAQMQTAAPQPPATPQKTRKPQPGRAVGESYTDTLPESLTRQSSGGFANYAVEVMNLRGRSAGLSNQVYVPLVETSPPPELHAKIGADGVLLTWQKLPPRHVAMGMAVYSVRIYRQEQGTATRAVAAEIPEFQDKGEYLDHGFEWEKTYQYVMTVATKASENWPGVQACSALNPLINPSPAASPSATPCNPVSVEIEGDDSAPVTVVAHDIYPPAVPQGLQAVFSGPGQQAFIDLTWQPNTEGDLAGYNVFRHEEGGAPVKINTELVKSPAYRDSNVQAGHKYFYSVSAADLRNNESARSEETSESVPE